MEPHQNFVPSGQAKPTEESEAFCGGYLLAWPLFHSYKR
jgi:hypothetical protein